MKRKRHYISLGWVVVAVLVSIAIHAFSHKEGRQEEESQEVTTTQQQSEGSWTTMPDSVVELCMAAPLKTVPEQVVRRTAYVASYNKRTRCPNWVAWQLTAEHTDGELKRMNNFHEDEECPLPRATPKDYKGSGWSRGHMCPAGDNKWNRRAMYDSFSLVNVCPQHPKLNSGVWNSIEMDCRKWARKYGEVYIVCGPVWTKGKHETIGENKVAVPEAFFKVVLCRQGSPKAIGFVYQNAGKKQAIADAVRSVDEIHRLTKMDFFPELDDKTETRIEAKAELADWFIPRNP